MAQQRKQPRRGKVVVDVSPMRRDEVRLVRAPEAVRGRPVSR